MIHWGNPSALLTLAALAPLAWLLVRAERRRSRDAARFADPRMLGRLMPAPGTGRPWLKGIALLAGLTCLAVAGARPRFGVAIEDISQPAADLVVLLDVSRSMLAQDVPPNRLEAAKAAIRSLLDQSRGDRVGLIAFAGKPVLRAPLTTDAGFVREVLEDIDTQSAPRGGTRIGDALLLGLETLPPEEKRDRAIVLITDGEDHESRLQAAIRQAAVRNVRVFTVAFGDPDTGARIPLVDESGRRDYLRYEGQDVWSKADEGLLRRIATQTNGGFVAVGSGGDHRGPAWTELLGGLRRAELHQQRQVRYAEQYQWFLGAGILLLLGEAAVARYPRQEDLPPTEDDP
jgi:Ca-activated chloride channel family protein